MYFTYIWIKNISFNFFFVCVCFNNFKWSLSLTIFKSIKKRPRLPLIQPLPFLNWLDEKSSKISIYVWSRNNSILMLNIHGILVIFQVLKNYHKLSVPLLSSFFLQIYLHADGLFYEKCEISLFELWFNNFMFIKYLNKIFILVYILYSP